MRAAVDFAQSHSAEHIELSVDDAQQLLAAISTALQTPSLPPPSAVSRFMSPADLAALTGMKRYSKQADWFKRTYGADVTRRDDGSIVMTWVTYEALNAKLYGVAPAAPLEPTFELCFD
ncbi:DUF4224 domain-containing protein [Paraburkholderia sp. BR10936]|uniref:DUF4224 domain-containing protein n=1 Tax=Paraburkholderia sp. BR10936 TaxID=3236993 RepID=UPI0034D1CDC6